MGSTNGEMGICTVPPLNHYKGYMSGVLGEKGEKGAVVSHSRFDWLVA